MIKNNKKIYAIVVLILTLFTSGMFADESYPNTSIAIVDLNLILSDSKAAKNATKQFEEIQKNIEDEIIASDKKCLKKEIS
jgi:Skp family chaperone for outer membrane proteins